jgi:hypothetical protein
MDMKNITPLERASLNATIHTARMALCESIQSMVQTLIELQVLIEDAEKAPPECDMYDPVMIEDMKREERQITRTLTNIASLVETQSGISA